MILCFDESILTEVYDYVLNNFVLLANNINSLCVVKKIIICSRIPQTRKRILDKILESIDILIHNANGNYAIQVAIDAYHGFYSKPIIQTFENKFYSLSLQKYSSNVIEKSLEKGGDVTVSKFIEEVCQKTKVMGNII